MDIVTISDFSQYGNKYFLSILNDYSRFGWVIFLKTKGEILNAFKNWYLQIKNISNINIKHLRTDNGTEFSNNFGNFCNLNGIIHKYTIPYSPQRNERIEQLHESLILNARAMLEEAHLNHVFWEDAIATANYIHNRIPQKGINNKIPYELLYGEKVDFSKFKVFGCQAFFFTFLSNFEINFPTQLCQVFSLVMITILLLSEYMILLITKSLSLILLYFLKILLVIVIPLPLF